jgi:hypothetical protein
MAKTFDIPRRLWALALIAAAASSWAQEPGQPAVTSSFQQVEATVQALDPATGHMTLMGPRGPLSFQVDPNLKNLDKVHVGDKIKVSYYEGIATQIVKNGTTIKAPATSKFDIPASNSAMPGHGVGRSMTTAVTIEAIDQGNNTVAFRGTDGTLRVVNVKSPNMQQFLRTLKPGDTVEVTYTESVAVNIVPAAGRRVAEGK